MISNSYEYRFGIRIGPDGQIEWDLVAIKRDLGSGPYGWNDEDIRERITNGFHGFDIRSMPYDSKSIMHYPLPRSWYKNTTPAGMIDISTLKPLKVLFN